MSLNNPSHPSSPERPNTLSKVTTTKDRQPQLWKDSSHDYDGFARLLNSLAETMTTDEAINICLFVESIADQFARGFTTVENRNTKIDLARGHGELNQLLSPSTIERAEAFELIKPPTIYNGWVENFQHKVARRTLWDLGSVAKEYLDMESIRGYDEETETLRSDANEGVAHRYIVRLAEHVYRGENKRVKTYVRSDSVAEIPEDLAETVVDIVAYNPDGSIYATCEVEMQPVDRQHITDDARLLAALPGDSDWVVHRKQDVNRLLDTFVCDGAITLPEGHPGWSAYDLSTSIAMERLQRVFEATDGSVPILESPIITSINTADNIRGMAQDVRPEIFSELNID
ncbi:MULTISPECIES: hypothetical protein [Haloferax]|uniref:Uncharacterized protein n=1 Tax=Haloferax marinum TaxID=2666143 RepID=A0A6A8G9D0_9EURY|nr:MULTISPECIES: hypothetical protein [Haloferax]KAB1198131.1 hypothetical protein Hfx1150_11610 [Haloferax sp. CBA1150]MRW97208.1 hypothetical protein [Haloferax marinum]